MREDSGKFDDLLERNKLLILNGIMGASTEAEVESGVFFARYLSGVGINPYNYGLFLRVLETNNKYIVDALIGPRDPRLLFAIIKPNYSLLEKAFQIITFRRPGQIYSKTLLAAMGIIEYSYHDANDGYKIYPLDISDINNIGKYLDQGKNQYDLINETALDILFRISEMGSIEYKFEKSLLAKHAHGIRMAYFDNTKRLTDIIPQLLMTQSPREDSEVKPSGAFLAFLDKFPNN